MANTTRSEWRQT